MLANRFDGDEEKYRAWLRENAAKGGSKRVRKGMAVLSPEERSQRARERVAKRWKKND